MKNTSQYRLFVISLFRYVQRLTKYEHQYEVGKKCEHQHKDRTPMENSCNSSILK